MEGNINAAASKAGFWYTIGNILLKGCVFFSLPIFTRILSTADFGIYNTYIAYEGILSAIIGLGLYGTVKNAKLDFLEKFDQYISSIFVMNLLAFCSVLILCNGLYYFIGNATGFSRLIVNCLLLQSFGSGFIHFYGIKLNVEFKYKPFLAISLFNTLGSIICSILLILFVFPNEKYLGRILGSVIAPIIVVMLMGSVTLARGKVFYNKQYWKYACAIGFPLIPHVVSQSLLSQFDRIMINNMVGSSEAGIYSYLYTICTITNIIALSMDNAWTPWLFYKIKDGKLNETYTASSKYTAGFAIITIGFMCVMPEISKIIASRDYWGGIDMIFPISLANYCIFLYLIPVSIEYYNKKTAFISLGTVLAAFLNLVLNYYGIQMFGYKAAAYTTLISYLSLFFFHALIAKKFNLLNIIDMKYIAFVTLSVFIIGAVFLFISFNYIISLMVRLSVLVMIMIIIFKQKDLLIKLLRKRE